MGQLRKIAWAVSPFIGSQAQLREVEKLGKAMGPSFRIEPVFVVSPAEFGVTFMSDSLKPEHLKATAARQLKPMLAKLTTRKSEFLPVRVLYEKEMKLADSTRTFARYTQRMGHECIVVGTRQDDSDKPFGIGSFTLSLLHAAKTSILALNPRAKAPASVKNLGFATDFSPESLAVFKRFCDFAKALGAKTIRLFHALPRPSRWFGQPFALDRRGFPVFSGEVYFKEIEKQARDRSEAFKKVAQKSGLKVEVELLHTAKAPAYAILTAAKSRKVGILGLASVTGRFWGGLLGSTTERIVGRANLPVWLARAPRSR